MKPRSSVVASIVAVLFATSCGPNTVEQAETPPTLTTAPMQTTSQLPQAQPSNSAPSTTTTEADPIGGRTLEQFCEETRQAKINNFLHRDEVGELDDDLEGLRIDVAGLERRHLVAPPEVASAMTIVFEAQRNRLHAWEAKGAPLTNAELVDAWSETFAGDQFSVVNDFTKANCPFTDRSIRVDLGLPTDDTFKVLGLSLEQYERLDDVSQGLIDGALQNVGVGTFCEVLPSWGGRSVILGALLDDFEQVALQGFFEGVLRDTLDAKFEAPADAERLLDRIATEWQAIIKVGQSVDWRFDDLEDELEDSPEAEADLDSLEVIHSAECS